MATVKISNLSTVWASSLIEHDAIKMNVIDSASSGSSKLLDLQIGSSSKFSVRRDGVTTATSFVGGHTGSLLGTSSFSVSASNSQQSNTSSFSVSASNSQQSNTSSYSSFSVSSSFSQQSNQSISASNSTSASFSISSSHSNTSQNANTSSYSLFSVNSNLSQNSVASTSASFSEVSQFSEYSSTSGHSFTSNSASYSSKSAESLTSVSASFGSSSNTASHAVSSLSSSYALNGGSLATGSTHNITSSWSTTASFALYTVVSLGSLATSASFSLSSSYAVSSSYGLSASHAVTSSYADRYAPLWPSSVEISGSGLTPTTNNVVNYVVTSASFSLFANALGNTPQYFKWYINASSSSLIQDGTSSVYNVTSSMKNPNSGIYTCQVTNSYGSSTSKNFQVQVIDPIELISETIPTSTPTVNSMVSFVVSATGDMVKYRWKKRGITPSLDSYVVDGIPSILNGGYASSTLTIQAISPDSEGSYFCEISNSVSNTSSSNMLIYVTAPTVVAQPSDLDSYGLSTVIATGSAISYSWEYNGIPIVDQTSPTLNLSTAVNDGNFTQTMMDQLSTLKCKVYNNVGYNYSNTIQVKPFKNSSAYLPTGAVTSTRGASNQVAIDATVQLVCPIGTIYTVYRNGVNVGSDVSPFGESQPLLTLHNVQSSNAGTYFVGAVFNGKSVVSDTVTLTISPNDSFHNVPPPVKYVFYDEVHTIVADFGISMGTNIATSPAAGNYRLDTAWRRSGNSTTYEQISNYASVPCPGPGSFSQTPAYCGGTLNMIGGVIVSSGMSAPAGSGVSYFLQYAVGIVYNECPINSTINPDPWSFLPDSDTLVATGKYGDYSYIAGTNLHTCIVMVQGVVGITTHPSGSQIRPTGSAVTFETVGNSSGSALHYRWYKNGTRIPDSDSSTYSISNCAASDSGTYTCLVGAKSLLSYRTMLSSGSVLSVI